MTSSRRLRTRAAYGTMRTPVRTNNDITVNGGPDGWVRDQGPTPWALGDTTDSVPPFWWVGVADEDGRSVIGPHGPHQQHTSIPVVTRAVSLLVDPLVSDPFTVEVDRYAVDRPVVRLTPPRWITDPHLCRPDDRYPYSGPATPQRKVRSLFWREWIVLALYWGRSYLYFIEQGDGTPTPGTLRVLNPHAVDVTDWGTWRVGDTETDRDGRIYYDFGKVGRLIRLDNPHHPHGVFEAHPNLFTLSRKLGRYTEGTFNSGIPAGYLKVTTSGMTKDQAEDLKASWLKNHGGDRRSIAVLNATTDFTPLALSPIDSALVEVKRSSIADLAYGFGMAPEVLGVTMGNSATYSNIKDWWRLHRDFALSPWADAIEGALSMLAPAAQSITVNLDASARPDESERLANYAVGIPLGVYTLDEARAEEGRAPIPKPTPALAPAAPAALTAVPDTQTEGVV